MRKKNIKILGFLTGIVLLSSVALTYALDYVNLAPLPGSCEEQKNGECITKIGKDNNLADYINGLYILVVTSAGVLAVLQIIMGGFSYVSTDAISGKEEGKHQIKMALGGLMLVFASYIILNTINPQLVELKIINKPLDSIGLKDFMKITMFSKTAQEKFGEAMDKTLSDLNKIKATRDEIRREADAVGQKAVSYREMEELQRLLSSPPSNPLDPNYGRIEMLKEKYLFPPEMTDDELKKFVSDGLLELEKEIKDKTGKTTIDEGLKALEDKKKDLTNYSDAVQKAKSGAVDAGKKVVEFNEEIRKNAKVVEDLNQTTLYISALDNDFKQRKENIEKLNLSDKKETERLIAEMKQAHDNAKKTICDKIPLKKIKSVQTQITTSYATNQTPTITYEDNPAYVPCK